MGSSCNLPETRGRTSDLRYIGQKSICQRFVYVVRVMSTCSAWCACAHIFA